MTNEKMVIGQFVYLGMKDLPVKKIDQNLTGIVRWAKSYPSTNGGTNGLYKYGVEYSKHIQANLN